jgi:hypothetical protein
MAFRSVRIILAFLGIAFLIPACGPFQGLGTPFPVVTLTAVLRGSQVAPSVATVSTGTASLVVDGTRTSIASSVSYSGAGVITAVEVRLGEPGANGPAIFTLATAPFANPLTGTLNEFNLVSAPSLGVITFADALDRILSGGAYLLLSTAGNPAGEIRGQLGAAALASAKLTGAQEVPPVATPGTGTATVTLNSDQTQIIVVLTVSGLAAISGAELRFGAAGVGGGPAIFNLATAIFTSPLTVTLTSADFMAAPAVLTYSDALNVLLSGQLYVNVDTTGNPTGEIRGQVGPANMSASLTGPNVVPPSGSAATGTATVILNGTQTAVAVTILHTVGSPTSALIHADSPGSNGPQIFDVGAISGSAVSPVTATLQSIHLIPSIPKGISNFADMTNALLTGKAYVDVGSAGFPAGEIRGQILP